MAFRNRIKERRRVKASDLIQNRKNPRLHPESQRDAMLGVLTEIGKCATLRAVETPEGLVLLDGHLRAELDASEEWDVDILDLTPDEADYLLATFDATTGEAEIDQYKLDALIAEIETGSAAVQEMLDNLKSYDEIAEVLPPELPEGDRKPIQQMTFTLSDDQAETVKAALAAALSAGPFADTGNENRHGNALARIAENYLGTS